MKAKYVYFYSWLIHSGKSHFMTNYPDSKVHGANMRPIWVLSAPDGPHVGPMNFAIRVDTWYPIKIWTALAMWYAAMYQVHSNVSSTQQYIKYTAMYQVNISSELLEGDTLRLRCCFIIHSNAFSLKNLLYSTSNFTKVYLSISNRQHVSQYWLNWGGRKPFLH